jgi:signal transduction histidine kinase
MHQQKYSSQTAFWLRITTRRWTMLALGLLAIVVGCQQPRNAHEEQEAVVCCYNKCRSFYSVNTDSVHYYLQVLQQEADTENPVHIGMLENVKGIYALSTGDVKTSIQNFGTALQIFEAQGVDTLVAIVNIGLANAYKMEGQYDKAIETLLRATAVGDRNSDESILMRCYSGLSQVYQLKGDLVQTQKYLQNAELLKKVTPYYRLHILHTKANVYGMSGQIDSALAVDDRGIALATQYDIPQRLSAFWDNKANCFLETNQLDSAEHYFFRCLEADKKYGQISLVSDTYCTLVDLYRRKNQPDKVLPIATQALQRCDSVQYTRGKQVVYAALAKFYQKEKQYEKGFAARDSAQVYFQKMVNEDREKKIATLQVQYETDKKERTIAQQQAQLNTSRYQMAFLASLVVLLLMGVAAIRRNEHQKRQFAIQQAIQAQKTANAQAVLESEQNERIRVARDLHDSIGQKLAALNMKLSANDAPNDTSVLLVDCIREVREISHNLIPESLHFGLLQAIENTIGQMTQNVGTRVSLNVSPACAGLQVPLSQSLHLLRIFQEIMGNALRHSKANNIAIDLDIKGQDFEIRCVDDGIGLVPKAIEQSKGIGWKNIFARLDVLQGDIDIQPNAPAGTQITVKAPIRSLS